MMSQMLPTKVKFNNKLARFRTSNSFPEANMYFCSQCAKGFKYERNLRTHEKTHAGTLPFSCCGKGFRSNTDLECHRCAVHGETERFICKTCGLGFARARSLQIHETKKSRSISYTCNVCNHKAATKDDLKEHLICHTDDKRYACKTCGKSYKHRSSMYKHMKKEHKSN